MLVLARRLGTSAMGVFFTLFAISAVIHWIADAGTTTVLTRRVARGTDNLRAIVAESMGMLPLVASASVLLFLATAAVWMQLSTGAVPWVVLAYAAAAKVTRHALDFAANIFRGIERFEFENLARVAQSVSFCVMVCVLVNEQSVLDAFWVYLLSNLLGVGIIWLLLLSRARFPAPRLSLRRARAWIAEGAPLGLGDVVRQLLLQLDTLMLAALRAPTAVGLFSVAARPLQPLQLVPRTLVSVTFPMMSRSGHTDREPISRLFAQSTNLLWVAALPISILIGFVAEPLILVTAGSEYVAAAGPLRLLIWATVLVFVNAQLRFVLTAIDAEATYSRLILRVLMFKVAINLALIPLLGVYGACLGNLLGEACLCLAGLYKLAQENITGPAITQLLRALPAAAGMAITMACFTPNDSPAWLLLGGLASMAVYASAALLFGALPRELVARLWRALIGPRGQTPTLKTTPGVTG